MDMDTNMKAQIGNFVNIESAKPVDETAIRSIATMIRGQSEELERTIMQLEMNLAPILKHPEDSVQPIPPGPSASTDFGMFLCGIYNENANLIRRLADISYRVHLD